MERKLKSEIKQKENVFVNAAATNTTEDSEETLSLRCMHC
jgi:hypothetical protein